MELGQETRGWTQPGSVIFYPVSVHQQSSIGSDFHRWYHCYMPLLTSSPLITVTTLGDGYCHFIDDENDLRKERNEPTGTQQWLMRADGLMD